MTDPQGSPSARKQAQMERPPSEEWRAVAERIHRDPLSLDAAERLYDLLATLDELDFSPGWRAWLLELCTRMEESLHYYEAFHDEGAFAVEFSRFAFPAIAEIRRALGAAT